MVEALEVTQGTYLQDAATVPRSRKTKGVKGPSQNLGVPENGLHGVGAQTPENVHHLNAL